MRTPVQLRMAIVASMMCVVACGDEIKAPAEAAAEVGKKFLSQLNEGQVNAALKLWDSKSGDNKLNARLEKMAAKVKSFGGITKVDVGTVEDRRIKAFEKQTGEKIDVVPVEIICGDGNLILAVFSVRKRDGQLKIFALESLKEWGGTASLDPELPYSN